MRKLVTLFTLLALTCIIQMAEGTVPPGYTGRLAVESKTVVPGESFTVKIRLLNNNMGISSLTIPLELSSSYLTCTYIDFTGSLVTTGMGAYSRIEGRRLVLSYIPDAIFPLPTITADSGLIATLYLTASPSAPNTSVQIDSLNYDSLIITQTDTLHFWTQIQFTDDQGIMTIIPDFIPGMININHPTDIKDDQQGLLPKALDLEQNYPNPFNPITAITFALPARSNVRLEVFNLLGQKVETLADGDFPAGIHTVSWNANNAPSGIYFYRLSTDKTTITRKMLLMK